MPENMECPIVSGGQGRDAAELVAEAQFTAVIWGLISVAMLVVAIHGALAL